MNLSELTYENVHASGGFAIIQRYKNLETNQKFAVKKINKELIDDLDYVERFIKEIEYTKRLRENKNIIDIFGEKINHDMKEFYYIMPLAKINLDKYIIKNNEHLNFSQRIYLFEQILNGIKFAHEKNIWHRDLTPTNILLFDEESSYPTVKICDFGLGKDPESLSRMANSSIGGHGQWMYVDPDQYDSLKNGTNISDIFSLGKILYFLITGKKPLIIQDIKFKNVIDKAINKEYDNVLEFEKDFVRMTDIYRELAKSESLTLQEYKEEYGESVNWEDFYKISLKASTIEHIYNDFMNPAMEILDDENQIKEFLDVVGNQDELFINRFVEALDYCHSSTGWPFNKLNDITKFLIRFAHASSSQTVKLTCLKNAWYIAAVDDQWISQDIIISTIEKHQFPSQIDDKFASYILETGKSFDKLKKINLNGVQNPKTKRAISKLRNS
ncbi:protein kinase domain-containing protein [Oceanobacillus kimchii]|uniref:Protein kinase domain-containing protein n=1 Tax=Oceanobacillus kimchii TaxID=746691 RepID=A0ABQ5TQL6_9BACI|nr:protein kinase [Oceanobacillus kimchii]GLO68475.1 hypothetical protein MACH08_42590 [Oceanobacillus kimchii]